MMIEIDVHLRTELGDYHGVVISCQLSSNCYVCELKHTDWPSGRYEAIYKWKYPLSGSLRDTFWQFFMDVNIANLPRGYTRTHWLKVFYTIRTKAPNVNVDLHDLQSYML